MFLKQVLARDVDELLLFALGHDPKKGKRLAATDESEVCHWCLTGLLDGYPHIIKAKAIAEVKAGKRTDLRDGVIAAGRVASEHDPPPGISESVVAGGGFGVYTVNSAYLMTKNQVLDLPRFKGKKLDESLFRYEADHKGRPVKYMRVKPCEGIVPFAYPMVQG